MGDQYFGVFDYSNLGCVDRAHHDLAEKGATFLRSVGLTPNMVTLLSTLFGFLGVWMLWRGYVWSFVILYVLSYHFDLIDGIMARKYNMGSKFGAHFDQVSDFFVDLAVLVVLSCQFPHWQIIMLIMIIYIVVKYYYKIYKKCIKISKNIHDDEYAGMCRYTSETHLHQKIQSMKEWAHMFSNIGIVLIVIFMHTICPIK